MQSTALRLLTGLGAAVLCTLWLSLAPALATASTTAAGNAVWCTAAGTCTAVGTFTETNGAQEGLLLNEVKGVWQSDQLAALPSNAAANPQVELNGLWCSAGPNCVAVGDYVDGAGNQQALVLTEQNGAWSTASEVKLPAGAIAGGSQMAELNGVWCSSASNCVAAGDYTDGQADQQGLTVTETSGTWGQGSATPVPANAADDPQVALTALDCTSISACDVVGIYEDQEGNQQAEILVGSAPSWGNGEMDLPADAALAAQQVQVNSLSCSASGECVGAGAFIDDSGNEQPLILLADGDSFSTLQAALPANADQASNPQAQLTSAWCSSAGNCTVVGDYYDTNSNQQGMVLDETNGIFARAAELSLPTDADQGSATDNPQATLDALWCSSAGNCIAGGGYSNVTQAEVPLVAVESNGAWRTGEELSLPKGAAVNGNQSASLASVWCGSATSCSAVGTFTSLGGNSEPLLFTGTAGGWSTGLAPGAPPNAAALKAALKPVVAAPAKTTLAKISHRGYRVRYVAGEPGKLALKWYRLGTLVAATATLTIPKPETVTLTLKLTAAGRRMLAGTKAGVKWAIQSQAQFTPSAAYGTTAITASRSFKLG
jgi:hypothetical protein